MGRGSEPQAPSYTGSEIMYGDQVVGKTYYDPSTNQYINQYYADPQQLQRDDTLNNMINSLAANVNTTSDQMAQQYQNIENSYVQDAYNKYLQNYIPAYESLKDDVNSRFGTLNSSEFLDGVNNLENQRSNALTNIIDNGEQLTSNLYSQDQSNKINELTSLYKILNGDENDALNTVSSSQSASDQINNYNLDEWTAKLNQYQQDLNSKRSTLANIIGSVARVVGKNGV